MYFLIDWLRTEDVKYSGTVLDQTITWWWMQTRNIIVNQFLLLKLTSWRNCICNFKWPSIYRASCPIHNGILWTSISKTTVNMNKFSERKRRIPHSSMIRLNCKWYRCESGTIESKYLNFIFFIFLQVLK